MTPLQTVLEAPSVVRERVITGSTLLRLAALTPAVLLVHGFHPFADDAGIYVAGIRKLVNPALFKPDAAFVLANTHLSLFAHLLAQLVHVVQMPLPVVLLATHVASIYLFLLACWTLATRVFNRSPERWFSVGLAAACFTLPAAGTALVLMDPYVTSRSFSTPLGLFAIAAVLDRRWGLSVILLVLTGLMHPQMVLYAAGLALLYAVVDNAGLRAAVLVSLVVIALAGLIYFMTRHEPISAAYYQAAHSRGRNYYFLAQWQWYEDFGLLAPLALFALAAVLAPRECRTRKLCVACVMLGVTCIAVSFFFVHPSGSYLLVRFEVLRGFHTLYLAGVLLLGGWIGFVLGHRHETRVLAVALLVTAAVGLYAAQRATYPLSAHIEWPGIAPRNPWVQAYSWIRANTPANAVFAASPDLVSINGEDMQGFRATTARSLLADDKDEGIAAGVDPSIADEWAAQRNAQVGILRMTDAERIARLKPFGVDWLLLPSATLTDFPCPYRNAVAKVCRMD